MKPREDFDRQRCGINKFEPRENAHFPSERILCELERTEKNESHP